MPHDLRIVEPLVETRSVSMKGVHVMLATPAMDGKPDMRYFTSFWETAKRIVEAGAEFSWHAEIYNADLVAARTKILREFHRSKCTHLLFIDSDMGWEFNAIARLFYAAKDLVAIVGPKKTDPRKKMEFAVNALEQMGEQKRLYIDPRDGCTEVCEVGMAFTLITRACVDRMVQACEDGKLESFRNLRYENDDGPPTYALFLPLIRGKRYFAEDFAFCRRWRDLDTPENPAKVYICADVPLKHVGFYTWWGAVAGDGPITEKEEKKVTGPTTAPVLHQVPA